MDKKPTVKPPRLPSQNADIYHFQIQVKALQPLTLRGYGGEEAHALFFTLLTRADSTLSDKLHHLPSKPFSLYLDTPPHRPEHGTLSLPEKETLLMHLHYFGPQPETIARSLLSRYPRTETPYLGTGKIKIQSVEVHFTSFETLLRNSEERTEILFHFLTPTCFRQKKMSILFPLPELVFGSLLNKWNDYSPYRFPPHLNAIFPQILVERYRLHTELVPFSRYKIIGFKGDCMFLFRENFSVPEKKMLLALCSFAPYAGIGYKITMGLGAVTVK
ncbi:MAG: CRISPR system precrRNA processing endoribonuclease RAMP protein Cas6 [bacterium JZ-2024 1]